MLADDYGTPVLYSGYAFDDRDAGAPADADGAVTPATCEAVHGSVGVLSGRRPHVRSGLDRDRRDAASGGAAVGDAPRQPGVDEGDAYGFEREGRGVVAVNLGDAEATIAVPTTHACRTLLRRDRIRAVSADDASWTRLSPSAESEMAAFHPSTSRHGATSDSSTSAGGQRAVTLREPERGPSPKGVRAAGRAVRPRAARLGIRRGRPPTG